MKVRFLKLKNWLLVSLMGALGLGACHSSKNTTKALEGNVNDPIEQPTDEREQPAIQQPRPGPALMYGVPTIEYQIKGKVHDSKGKPVKGLQVVLINNTIDATVDTIFGNKEHIENYVRQASDTTDAEGNFEVRMRDMPSDKQRLLIRDIDGATQGVYENQMLEVPYKQEELRGQQGQGWNMGTVGKEVDVEVKSK